MFLLGYVQNNPPLIEQVVVVLFFKNIVFFHGKSG